MGIFLFWFVLLYHSGILSCAYLRTVLFFSFNLGNPSRLPHNSFLYKVASICLDCSAEVSTWANQKGEGLGKPISKVLNFLCSQFFFLIRIILERVISVYLRRDLALWRFCYLRFVKYYSFSSVFNHCIPKRTPL